MPSCHRSSYGLLPLLCLVGSALSNRPSKRFSLLQLQKGLSASSADTASYEAFVRTFRPESLDETRRAVFLQRRAEIEAHNAQPGITWKATVNKFTDYTDAELQGMLGYRSARHLRAAHARSGSLVELKAKGVALADEMDWTHRSNLSVPDQGNCGSCWATAAAGAIEAHGLIGRTGGAPFPLVSFEEMVDCAPNPQQCGGTGGCEGSTPDLAFDYIKENGLVLASEYKGYQTVGEGPCKRNSVASAVKLTGWVHLPTNELHPLLDALANIGPVTVAADATLWYSYWVGIYDRCTENAIVNHAIVAMGYGYDPKYDKKYWLIRNSWGPTWGEQGYIRLLRHNKEGEFCGVDTKPEDGVGCKGGEPTLPVCGMCGILSASSYPTGVHTVMHQTAQSV